MGMQFKFEGNLYLASMTASELYGNGRAGSTGNNIPIKLPDGRLIKVSEWMESYPPQAGGFIVINGDELDRYATAELLDN
jgi:hypothetical protein